MFCNHVACPAWLKTPNSIPTAPVSCLDFYNQCIDFATILSIIIIKYKCNLNNERPYLLYLMGLCFNWLKDCEFLPDCEVLSHVWVSLKSWNVREPENASVSLRWFGNRDCRWLIYYFKLNPEYFWATCINLNTSMIAIIQDLP